MSCEVQVALVAVMEKGYRFSVESDLPFWRDVCLGWMLLAGTCFLEDINSLFVLAVFNIKVAANFDCPWMSQSVTEFWSKRYNLVFGQTLKDMAHSPICEGKSPQLLDPIDLCYRILDSWTKLL